MIKDNKSSGSGQQLETTTNDDSYKDSGDDDEVAPSGLLFPNRSGAKDVQGTTGSIRTIRKWLYESKIP